MERFDLGNSACPSSSQAILNRSWLKSHFPSSDFSKLETYATMSASFCSTDYKYIPFTSNIRKNIYIYMIDMHIHIVYIYLYKDMYFLKVYYAYSEDFVGTPQHPQHPTKSAWTPGIQPTLRLVSWPMKFG